MIRAGRRLLFLVARSRLAAYVLGFGFQYGSALIPVAKVDVSPDALIFYHPRPFWELHLLAVPKKRVRSFLDLDFRDTNCFAMALRIFASVQAVMRTEGLEGATLLLNGGRYQDVQQIHGHIGRNAVGDEFARLGEDLIPPWRSDLVFGAYEEALAYGHPVPKRSTHLVIATEPLLPPFLALDFTDDEQQQRLLATLILAQDMIKRLRLDRYSLVVSTHQTCMSNGLMVHLISGARVVA